MDQHPEPACTGPPVVLVVGSTGHIGAELVRQLRERGGVRVVEASRSAGGDQAVRLDIHDEASVRALDKALPDGVDHVVICCGASTFGPLASFDSSKWTQSCEGKLMAVSRLIVMLANGQELRCLRDSGSITVTTGQAGRVVNKMWPGIAANNAGLDAMVRCAGVDAPRGVRINAVAPALVRETAEKAGLPLEGTVRAADAAAAYPPLVFGQDSGLVVDAGTQTLFDKSHHSAQKDSVAPASGGEAPRGEVGGQGRLRRPTAWRPPVALGESTTLASWPASDAGGAPHPPGCFSVHPLG
eukprot:CAMPEP_0171184676 /NCGR_PEP_ID=MMETSP0790-20130122/15907_1 /TAXON_ID=2925 /ORGANISM="Alexandrium catenella, Strain OF101" /LENGTH=298 /DNA_ID=CAMNT_0011649671 /DNA_START=52 /DNA_END=949 /DNA_ORIENTATION=+